MMPTGRFFNKFLFYKIIDVITVVPRPLLQYTKSPSSDRNPGPFLLHHYFSV